MADSGVTNKKETDHEFLLKCIEVYRSLPALWKVKSADYKDRDKKARSWSTLLEVYKERFPAAAEEDVKKKFNSMRTNFRGELKKVIASKKSGQGADEVYTSTKWFFNAFAQFLTDQETPASSINTMEEGNMGSSYQSSDVEEIEDIESCAQRTLRPEAKQQLPKKSITMKRKNEDLSDELLELACSRMRQSVPTSNQYHTAVNWAREIDNMAPEQQIYAKRFISEILFEGQMGTLHRNSVVINQSAREQSRTPVHSSVSSYGEASRSYQRTSPYDTFPHSSPKQQEHNQQLIVLHIPQDDTAEGPMHSYF